MKNNSAINFLEQNSYTDEDGIQYLSIHDAITACRFQELESLQNSYIIHDSEIEARIKDLQKQLKHIKLK